MFVTKTKALSKEGKAFSKEILTSWQAALGNILEVCNLLREAKLSLDKSDFNVLINDHLPFGRRIAERLLKVASDKRLTAKKNRKLLPPHWTSLYELTQITNEEFNGAVTNGEIFPDMERKDVTLLVYDKKNSRKNTASANTTSTKSNPNKPPITGKSTPVNGSGFRHNIAKLFCTESLAAWQIEEIEKSIHAVATKHKIEFEIIKPNVEKKEVQEKRQALAAETQAWLVERSKTYNQGFSEEDLILVKDAFFQLTNDRPFLNTLEDGSYAINDIRNEQNPYHGWETRDLYRYCKDNLVLTQYSNLEEIDYEVLAVT